MERTHRTYIYIHPPRVHAAILGFNPDSEFRNMPFTPSTYYLDPIKPPLADLLSLGEAQRYGKEGEIRPSAVMCGSVRADVAGTDCMHMASTGMPTSTPAPARAPWPRRST